MSISGPVHARFTEVCRSRGVAAAAVADALINTELDRVDARGRDLRKRRGPAPVIRQRVLELIAAGGKPSAIAAAAGCSDSYVHKIGRSVGLPSPWMSAETKADILARLHAGESYRSIAERHAITYQRVGQIAKAAGIRRQPFVDRFDAQIREGNAAGHTTRVLARAIGTTQKKISERQRQLGLAPVGQQIGRAA